MPSSFDLNVMNDLMLSGTQGCNLHLKNLGDVTPREISQVQKVLIDSRHLRCPEQADPQRQKGDGWLPGAGERWESKR